MLLFQLWEFYIHICKYLGLLEHDTIKDSQIKSMITAKYKVTKQRARKVLKSSLNGKNVITTVNTWAVPLICHSWNYTLDTD